jgi:hypothetical protein
MRQFRCVCGKSYKTLKELVRHCNHSQGVHEEAGPDEDVADAAQASPDAPGDAQAPVHDPMSGTAPAEAQSEDESVGVPTRQYGTVSLPTPSVTFTAQLVPAQDRRMETIRAWATAAMYAYANSHVSHAAQKDLVYSLDRIIELAGDR